MEISEINSHQMSVTPENVSIPEKDSEKLQEKTPVDSINLMTSESMVPKSQARKYIKVIEESASGSDKNYFFRDLNNQLLYKSTLSQGSLSKSAKCVIQSTNGGVGKPMSFDAQSKICCNGKWKIAELRNETGAVIGLLEMRIPVNIDLLYISEEGLAVSIKNNNGEAMFKIKMASGPQRSRNNRKLGQAQVVQKPYIFEVLSAAYGQNSVGKIFLTSPVYNCCGPSSTHRGYSFEYILPLDSQTLSMILCGVMALETCFTDELRNGKYLAIGFGIFFCCIVLFIIISKVISAVSQN